jgi:hypothetical protein
MRIVEAIIIDGVVVTVTKVSHLSSNGEYDPDKVEIRVPERLFGEMLRRVLIHEITHAIMHICCQCLADVVAELHDPDSREELIAEQVGEKLYQVLNDNPKLRETLRW